MLNGPDAKSLQRLEDAVANLPWFEREIFMLHAVEAYSYAEIAWLLNTSERNVERQMAKAIYKLGKQLDGHRLSWWERRF